MNDFDLGSMQVTNGGLDSFLGDNTELVTPLGAASKQACSTHAVSRQTLAKPRPRRVKVASLTQLAGFIRTAEDTLIHKSDRDLWSLRKDGHGEFYIERMFDDSGSPLKG